MEQLDLRSSITVFLPNFKQFDGGLKKENPENPVIHNGPLIW